VIADEPDSVAWMAVDAKLRSVFAESGVDLLEFGLDVFFRFSTGDDLGTNVR